MNNNMETYEQQFVVHQQQMQHHENGDVFGELFNNNHVLSSQEQQQAAAWSMPPVHPFNPVRDHEPFLVSPPIHQQPFRYGTFLNHPLGYKAASSSENHMRIISESIGRMVQPPRPFELAKMTAQEIMEAKALAASKSHSEAERRRRERINNHLARLRSLLPNTTKTDKASLLAEVIEQVKELKRQTSVIAERNPVPTESDEVTVEEEEEGKFVIKASICCQDRSDLLPELIKTLKSLRLRTLKAEITTVGGRVKNVLFMTGEQQHYCCCNTIQQALKAVMDNTHQSPPPPSNSNLKRQRNQ